MPTTAVALAAVAVLALGLLLGYNRLVTLRNRTEAAWADLDVQLERRRDLIPNLVATVRGYAAHEREALDTVTSLRTAGSGPDAAGGRSRAEARLGEAVADLFAVAEAYPDLQADRNFRQLHDELVATENKIAFSRQLFNDTVNGYRNATESFPGLLYAGPLGFRPPGFFEAAESERVVREVRLGET